MPPGIPVPGVLGELVVDLIPDAGPQGPAPHYIARPGGNALNLELSAVALDELVAATEPGCLAVVGPRPGRLGGPRLPPRDDQVG